jgi:murein DD-endopeptidase MepM/ murein hydrolase activator NlpD
MASEMGHIRQEICMQSWRTCLRVALPVAVAMPAVVAALTPPAPHQHDVDTLVAALPVPSSEKVWIRVRDSVSIDDLSSKLKVSGDRLASLNDVEPTHQFRQGEWLIVPAKQIRQVKLLASLDPSELRRTPPLQDLPPLEEGLTARQAPAVRFGDSIKKIAQRYGITLQQLLQLNPGLDTAKLVVGSEIKLSQASPVRPNLLIGLAPSGSGGISWPELPNFGNSDKPFDSGLSASGWIWPTRGLFSSGYGWRWGRIHKGIDVANSVGTPIVAAKKGRVMFSGWDDGGYGYKVLIGHEDGSQSLYAHNSRLAVKVGQTVEQGELVSYMGSTGRSTGPHLHFEIHPPGRGAMNPLQFLPPRA